MVSNCLVYTIRTLCNGQRLAGEQAVSPLHVLGKDEQTQRVGKLQRVTSSCVQGACSLMMFNEPGELNGPIELALGPSAAYSPRSRLTFLRKLLMRHVQVVRCESLDWDRVLLPQTAVRWIEYQAVAYEACEHAAPNLSAALVTISMRIGKAGLRFRAHICFGFTTKQLEASTYICSILYTAYDVEIMSATRPQVICITMIESEHITGQLKTLSTNICTGSLTTAEAGLSDRKSPPPG